MTYRPRRSVVEHRSRKAATTVRFGPGALAVLLSACSPSEYPRQSEALSIVWNLYAPSCAPPAIEWARDCEREGKPGVTYRGTCFAGLAWPGYVRLAWWGSFSSSAYAHELLHATHYCAGVEDPQHQRTEWQTIEPRARERLRERGL